MFTNGSVASGLGVTKMADLSKEAMLQAIQDQDLRFLAVSDSSMCLQRFWNIFTKNLISSDRRQYFYPNVISSFLKLLNARKSFNYYS